jgi:excinuclease ABC subunit C
MAILSLRSQADALPITPGVYLFKDEAGEILYVGKAINLRDRVRSYFATDIGRGAGIDNMVRLARTIDYLETNTEVAALLLEAKLIRQHKPHYNIRLRDDKSFSLIRINMDEPFPGIYLAREKDLEEILARLKRSRSPRLKQRIENQEFYGPYLSSYSVKQALRTIRKIWPYRDCTSTKFNLYAGLGRGCLFASLGLCPAPCVPTGRQERATSEEEKQLCGAAVAAARLAYSDTIDQIRSFLRGEQVSLIKRLEKDMEAAAAGEEYERAALLRDRLQALRHLQQTARMYSHTLTLNNRENGEKQGEPYNATRDIRVEFYDISNNQGAYAVGVLVSGRLRDGKVKAFPDRASARANWVWERQRYRKFIIKTVAGISDTDMLGEVLTRRFRRGLSADNRWSLPDLIMVDGGQGQLTIAGQAWKNVAGEGKHLNLAAVAKGPTRKKVDLLGEYAVFQAGVSDDAWRQVAEAGREEAHRFAITFYRSRHRKGLLI